MKYLNIIKSILLISVIWVAACDAEKELTEAPPHLMTSANLFSDDTGFEMAINGLYGRVRMEWIKFIFLPNKVQTDNQVCNSCFWGYNLEIKELGSRVVPTATNVLAIWNHYYQMVNKSNNIIAGAEADDAPLTSVKKNLVLADARAVRAFAYRALTYYWGDVPMPLVPSSGETIRDDWERTPINQVREQMLEDFQFAYEFIPSVEGTMPGRITKGAIGHYIAETYLAMGDDGNALLWANRVIDDPAHELITERFGALEGQPGVPFIDMFHPRNTAPAGGNTETLWTHHFEFGVLGGGYRTDLYYTPGPHPRYLSTGLYEMIGIGGVQPFPIIPYRNGRGVARLSHTKWALELYEHQDDRRSEHAIWFYLILRTAEENAPHPADRLPPGYNYGDTIWLDYSVEITPSNENRVNWPYSRKFKWAIDDNPAIRENYHPLMFLRLAETYMVKAEAQYNLGDAQDAAETLNIIRRRSNASEISAADVDIDFILDERSRELMHEEQRRFQLVRTGKWLERTSDKNPSAAQRLVERNVLFPIPQSVIDANKTPMSQNPGYN